MKGKLGTPATLCYLLSGISGYNQDIMKSQRVYLVILQATKPNSD